MHCDGNILLLLSEDSYQKSKLFDLDPKNMFLIFFKKLVFVSSFLKKKTSVSHTWFLQNIPLVQRLTQKGLNLPKTYILLTDETGSNFRISTYPSQKVFPFFFFCH